MTLKKTLSILSLLAIAVLTFSACEDINDPGDPTTAPGAVTNIWAGQSGAASIQIAWDTVDDATSYDFTVYNGATVVQATKSITATGSEVHETFTVPETGVEYTFEVVAVNSVGKSAAKTIKWATAKYYTGVNETNTIKVYASASVDYGSGLELYNASVEEPKIWKVANSGNWNLGLYTKDNKLYFGSADKLGYTGTFSNAAAITTPLANDYDQLSGLVSSDDLSTYTYTNEYIDLNQYNTRAKGIVFFAKTKDNHYARIIVKKIGGKWLQEETSSNPYIVVAVSYQHSENLPYAKPIVK